MGCLDGKEKLAAPKKALLDSRLASSFHCISWMFMDFELLGLLGSLALLEGVFCVLALLEGGLNHVVSHARRPETSADMAVLS